MKLKEKDYVRTGTGRGWEKRRSDGKTEDLTGDTLGRGNVYDKGDRSDRKVEKWTESGRLDSLESSP